MLHSKSLLKRTQQTNNELDNLGFQMKQRLVQLEFIQKLLKGTDHKQAIQERMQSLEDQCQQSHLQLRNNNTTLSEKTKALERAQNDLDKVQASLDSLTGTYKSDMEEWHRKYTFSQNQLLDIQIEFDEKRGQLEQQVQERDQKIDKLGDLNQQLEIELEQQAQQLEVELEQQAQQLEVELQEQAKHLQVKLQRQLKNSEVELKQQTQSNQGLEKSLKSMQYMVDEKDKLIETYKTQIDPEEHYKLLCQLENLQEENEQCKKRLNNLNELYHSREEPEGDKCKQSRIPVLSNRAIQQQHDLTKELNLMKDDLLLYQDKLVEKISQNKQLESAMERVNEHVLILRKSLNDTREESNDRYKNMMKYMEENRLLREQLDASR